jgi:drug/metabolite transporter (DMT)-like permease
VFVPLPPSAQGGPLSAHARLVALGLAAAGAIAFSGKAIIVKLAYRHGVDAVTLLMYRMLFALPMFLALAWWASRGQAPLSWRDRVKVLTLGFSGYYLSSFLDFAGLAYISASLERLILYLSPTIVLVLGVVLYRRPVSLPQLLSMVLSYAGVVLVFGHELNLHAQGTLLGASLVFASAVTYSLYLTFSGEVVKRLGSFRLIGLASSVACLCCIAQFVILRPLSAAQVAEPVIWLSVLNATACTFAPGLMVMMAIERIGATLTSQIGMVGPVSTIIMGVLILGEPFTVWTAAGSALVMLGVALLGRAR